MEQVDTESHVVYEYQYRLFHSVYMVSKLNAAQRAAEPLVSILLIFGRTRRVLYVALENTRLSNPFYSLVSK